MPGFYNELAPIPDRYKLQGVGLVPPTYVDSNGVLQTSDARGSSQLAKLVGKGSPAQSAYLKAPGTTVLDMKALGASFTKSGSGGGGSSTQTVSTDNYWPGSTAVDFTNSLPTAGNVVWWIKDLASPTVIFGTAPTMVVPVKFTDYTTINGFTVELSMGDATYTNVFKLTWNVGPGGAGRMKQSGWQLVHSGSASDSQNWQVGAGAPNWATMAIFSVKYTATLQTSGVPCLFSIDNIIFNRQAQPKWLQYFDLGYIEQYTVARPILNDLGIRATFAITPEVLGTDSSTYMNADQVRQLVSDGHALAFRPVNGFGGRPALQCLVDVANAQRFMRQQFGAAGEAACAHIVYNQGQYWPGSGGTTNAIGDRTLIPGLQALGVVSGRTTETTGNPDRMRLGAYGSGPNLTSPIPNLMTHGIVGSYAGNTVATLTSAIDFAIDRQCAVAYFIHQLLTTDANAATPEGFRQVMEYLVSKRTLGLIDTMTLPDFYAGL